VYLFRLIYDFISLYWYHIFSFFSSCCSYILLALKISNQSLNIVIMRVILSNLDFPCNFSIQFNDFCYASRKYMHLREYFLLFCCLNVEMILCERMQHFYILCICLLFAGDISCLLLSTVNPLSSKWFLASFSKCGTSANTNTFRLWSTEWEK